MITYKVEAVFRFHRDRLIEYALSKLVGSKRICTIVNNNTIHIAHVISVQTNCCMQAGFQEDASMVLAPRAAGLGGEKRSGGAAKGMPRYWFVTAVAEGKAVVLPETIPMERLMVVGIVVCVTAVLVTVTVCAGAEAHVEDGGKWGEPH